MCLLSLLSVDVNATMQEGKGPAKSKPPAKDTNYAEVTKAADVTWKISDGTFKFVGSKLNVQGKVVTGAPYSATATTESIQVLSDGNQIIRKNEALIYRDSEGRVRIEQELGTIGKWTSDGDPARIIYINDPVALKAYTLDPRSRRAFGNSNPQGAVEIEKNQLDNAKTLARELEEAKRREIELASSDAGPAMKTGENRVRKVGDPRRKNESLGNQVIEGVQVEGTRSTLTIPAGEIGNVQPIEVVDETWYSPELQIVVLSKTRDPRFGDLTYKLTNINRSDPDRSLFDVPADYRIEMRNQSKKTLKPAPAKKARQL
jgi:hypothetical protein